MADYTLSVKINGDANGLQQAMKVAQKAVQAFEDTTDGLGIKMKNGIANAMKTAQKAVDNFSKTAQTAGKYMQDMGSAIESAGKSLSVVSAAVGAGTAFGVKYNATIQDLTTQFEVMTGSAEKAADIVGELQTMGAKTPFEFTDLAKTTNTMMQFGFSADEAMDSLQMLGDIAQGNAQKLESITRAYSKMHSSQKVTLEDINMMIDAGFNPLQQISEQTGESMQSMYDRISAGSMSVDEITTAMQKATAEGGTYFQSMEKQSQTFNGQLSTLQDNISQFAGFATEGIFGSLANNVLPAINDALSAINEGFSTGGLAGAVDAIKQIAPALEPVINVAEAVGKALNSIGINPAVFTSIVISAGPVVTILGKGVSIAAGLVTKLGSVAGVIAKFISPMGLAVTAGAGFVALLTHLYQTSDSVRSGIDGIISSVSGLMSNIGSGLMPIIQTLQDMLSNSIDAIMPGIESGISTLLPVIQMLVDTVSGFVSSVMPMLLEVVQQLAPLITQLWEIGGQLFALLSQVIAQIAESLMPVIDTVINTVLNIASAVLPVLMNVIEAVMATIRAVYPIVEGIITIVGNVISTVISIITPIIAFIGQVITAVMNIILPIVSWIADIITGIMNLIAPIIDFVVGVVTDIHTIVTGIIQGIANFIGTTVNVIGGIVNGLISVFSGVFSTISGIVDSVMSTVGSVIGGVLSGVQGAWSGLTGFVNGVFNGISSAVQGLVNTVKRFVNGVIGGINSAIGLINMIPGVNIGYIPFLAHGTDDFAGGFAVINEAGRGELVNLPDGSQVIPHDVSMRYAREAGQADRGADNDIDLSGILSGVVIEVNSSANLDGKAIYEGSYRYTVNRIGKGQRAVLSAKGVR